jgi:hypothetical protein
LVNDDLCLHQKHIPLFVGHLSIKITSWLHDDCEIQEQKEMHYDDSYSPSRKNISSNHIFVYYTAIKVTPHSSTFHSHPHPHASTKKHFFRLKLSEYSNDD